MKFAKYLACLLVLAFGFGSVPSLLAQGTDLGTIRGSVTDASGALVAGAKVVILDISTGTTRETTTNAQGDYQMFGLRPGNYKVTVSMANMRTREITGVLLNGSAVVDVNAVLGVSIQQETIEVTSEAPTINTADQTIA